MTDKLIREISEIHTIVKSLDKKINGNGKIGMYDEFQQWKGGLKLVAFLLVANFGLQLIRYIWG